MSDHASEVEEIRRLYHYGSELLKLAANKEQDLVARIGLGRTANGYEVCCGGFGGEHFELCEVGIAIAKARRSIHASTVARPHFERFTTREEQGEDADGGLYDEPVAPERNWTDADVAEGNALLGRMW